MQEPVYLLLIEVGEGAHRRIGNLSRPVQPFLADGDEGENPAHSGVGLGDDIEEELLGLTRPDEVVDDEHGVARIDGPRRGGSR